MKRIIQLKNSQFFYYTISRNWVTALPNWQWSVKFLIQQFFDPMKPFFYGVAPAVSVVVLFLFPFSPNTIYVFIVWLLLILTGVKTGLKVFIIPFLRLSYWCPFPFLSQQLEYKWPFYFWRNTILPLWSQWLELNK